MLARLLTATAACALLAGAASAQTPSSATAAPTAAQPAPSTSTSTSQPMPSSGAAPTAAAPTTAATGDIVATAQGAGKFTTLLKAAEATGLTPVLKSPGPLTVFAPTDEAFAALPAGELDRLMKPENAAELQKLLTAHIVNTRVGSDQVTGKKGDVPTVAGNNVTIDGTNGVMVNDAKVVQADVRATNGVIHVIDKVLLPAGATATASTDADAATSADGAAANASATATPAAPAGAAPAPTAPRASGAAGATATPADPAAGVTAPGGSTTPAPASSTAPATPRS